MRQGGSGEWTLLYKALIRISWCLLVVRWSLAQEAETLYNKWPRYTQVTGSVTSYVVYFCHVYYRTGVISSITGCVYHTAQSWMERLQRLVDRAQGILNTLLVLVFTTVN